MPTKDKKSFIPSDSIKRSISTWEGIAMDGPSIDPLSKKLVKRNNSFEREAELFYNAIPENLRDTILSNQSLADNLYSYSYNVGSGNFKKRVVPALEHYYKNKVKLGTNGRHEYGTGRDIIGKQYVDLNGDVYLLKENSGRILPPFKSADYVHPSLISNGKMLPPNWNIRDAFKIGIPAISILNTLDLK